jgi:hypothetical protein
MGAKPDTDNATVAGNTSGNSDKDRRRYRKSPSADSNSWGFKGRPNNSRGFQVGRPDCEIVATIGSKVAATGSRTKVASAGSCAEITSASASSTSKQRHS